MMNSNSNFAKSAIVMIDVVVGMTSNGSFGLKYGKDEVKYIDGTVKNIENFIRKNTNNFAAKCLVRSIYQEGKFTNDKSDPLYNLCVQDSKDIDNLFSLDDSWVEINKDENDTMKDIKFKNWIQNLNTKSQIDNLYIIGFTLTSCVRQTELSIADFFKENNIKIKIILPLNLISYRASYEVKKNNKSIVDKVIEELKDSNVIVIDKIDI